MGYSIDQAKKLMSPEMFRQVEAKLAAAPAAVPKIPAVKAPSPEDILAEQMRAAGLPEPCRQFRFAPPRRWLFDFSWPEMMIAVEVEGGTARKTKDSKKCEACGEWPKGRHATMKGYQNDCEKYTWACIKGWMLLRFTTQDVRKGKALPMIEIAFAERKRRGTTD